MDFRYTPYQRKAGTMANGHQLNIRVHSSDQTDRSCSFQKPAAARHRSRHYRSGDSEAKTVPLPPGPPPAHKMMDLKSSDGKKYPNDITMTPAPAYAGSNKSKMFQNKKAMTGRCTPIEVDPPPKHPNRMSRDVIMRPAAVFNTTNTNTFKQHQPGRSSPMEVDPPQKRPNPKSRDVIMRPAAVFNRRKPYTFKVHQPSKSSPMEVDPPPKHPTWRSRDVIMRPAAVFNTKNSNAFRQHQPSTCSPMEVDPPPKHPYWMSRDVEMRPAVTVSNKWNTSAFRQRQPSR
ncbi:hypothetical protein NQZ68_031188 [Dissostichus eleginoides]|nr:hypothetical protein NQZ68_031188 [Dissostichus eleginoides]